MLRTISLFIITCAASPALAMSVSSIAIPEPGAFGLFALGVVGLMVGRHASRRP